MICFEKVAKRHNYRGSDAYQEALANAETQRSIYKNGIPLGDGEIIGRRNPVALNRANAYRAEARRERKNVRRTDGSGLSKAERTALYNQRVADKAFRNSPQQVQLNVLKKRLAEAAPVASDRAIAPAVLKQIPYKTDSYLPQAIAGVRKDVGSVIPESATGVADTVADDASKAAKKMLKKRYIAAGVGVPLAALGAYWLHKKD